jgi:hypothetical protein
VHELAQLSWFRKPDQREDVIGLLIKNTEQNPLGLVMVKQVSSTVAGKGHKMRPELVIENPAFFRHETDCTQRLLLLRSTDSRIGVTRFWLTAAHSQAAKP